MMISEFSTMYREAMRTQAPAMFKGTDAQRQNAGARAPEGAGGEPNADGNASGRAAGGRKRVSGGRRAGTGGDARVSAGEPRNHVIEAGGLREDRGWAQKARDNIRAIEIIRELEAEGATPPQKNSRPCRCMSAGAACRKPSQTRAASSAGFRADRPSHP